MNSLFNQHPIILGLGNFPSVWDELEKLKATVELVFDEVKDKEIREGPRASTLNSRLRSTKIKFEP